MLNELRMTLCERLLGLILWIIPVRDKDGHRLALLIQRYFTDMLTETLGSKPIALDGPANWVITGNRFMVGNKFYNDAGKLMTPEELQAWDKISPATRHD